MSQVGNGGLVQNSLRRVSGLLLLLLLLLLPRLAGLPGWNRVSPEPKSTRCFGHSNDAHARGQARGQARGHAHMHTRHPLPHKRHASQPHSLTHELTVHTRNHFAQAQAHAPHAGDKCRDAWDAWYPTPYLVSLGSEALGGVASPPRPAVTGRQSTKPDGSEKPPHERQGAGKAAAAATATRPSLRPPHGFAREDRRETGSQAGNTEAKVCARALTGLQAKWVPCCQGPQPTAP